MEELDLEQLKQELGDSNPSNSDYDVEQIMREAGAEPIPSADDSLDLQELMKQMGMQQPENPSSETVEPPKLDDPDMPSISEIIAMIMASPEGTSLVDMLPPDEDNQSPAPELPESPEPQQTVRQDEEVSAGSDLSSIRGLTDSFAEMETRREVVVPETVQELPMPAPETWSPQRTVEEFYALAGRKPLPEEPEAPVSSSGQPSAQEQAEIRANYSSWMEYAAANSRQPEKDRTEQETDTLQATQPMSREELQAAMAEPISEEPATQPLDVSVEETQEITIEEEPVESTEELQATQPMSREELQAAMTEPISEEPATQQLDVSVEEAQEIAVKQELVESTEELQATQPMSREELQAAMAEPISEEPATQQLNVSVEEAQEIAVKQELVESTEELQATQPMSREELQAAMMEPISEEPTTQPLDVSVEETQEITIEQEPMEDVDMPPGKPEYSYQKTLRLFDELSIVEEPEELEPGKAGVYGTQYISIEEVLKAFDLEAQTAENFPEPDVPEETSHDGAGIPPEELSPKADHEPEPSEAPELEAELGQIHEVLREPELPQQADEESEIPEPVEQTASEPVEPQPISLVEEEEPVLSQEEYEAFLRKTEEEEETEPRASFETLLQERKANAPASPEPEEGSEWPDNPPEIDFPSRDRAAAINVDVLQQLGLFSRSSGGFSVEFAAEPEEEVEETEEPESETASSDADVDKLPVITEDEYAFFMHEVSVSETQHVSFESLLTEKGHVPPEQPVEQRLEELKAKKNAGRSETDPVYYVDVPIRVPENAARRTETEVFDMETARPEDRPFDPKKEVEKIRQQLNKPVRTVESVKKAKAAQQAIKDMYQTALNPIPVENLIPELATPLEKLEEAGQLPSWYNMPLRQLSRQAPSMTELLRSGPIMEKEVQRQKQLRKDRIQRERAILTAAIAKKTAGRTPHTHAPAVEQKTDTGSDDGGGPAGHSQKSPEEITRRMKYDLDIRVDDLTIPDWNNEAVFAASPAGKPLQPILKKELPAVEMTHEKPTQPEPTEEPENPAAEVDVSISTVPEPPAEEMPVPEPKAEEPQTPDKVARILEEFQRQDEEEQSRVQEKPLEVPEEDTEETDGTEGLSVSALFAGAKERFSVLLSNLRPADEVLEQEDNTEDAEEYALSEQPEDFSDLPKPLPEEPDAEPADVEEAMPEDAERVVEELESEIVAEHPVQLEKPEPIIQLPTPPEEPEEVIEDMTVEEQIPSHVASSEDMGEVEEHPAEPEHSESFEKATEQEFTEPERVEDTELEPLDEISEDAKQASLDAVSEVDELEPMDERSEDTEADALNEITDESEEPEEPEVPEIPDPAQEIKKWNTRARSLGRRSLLVAVIMVISVYISCASDFRLPLSRVLDYSRTPDVALVVLIACGVLAGLAAYDIIVDGVRALLRLQPDFSTLVTIALALGLVHSAVRIVLDGEEIPYVAIDIVALFALMRARIAMAAAQRNMYRTVANNEQPVGIFLHPTPEPHLVKRRMASRDAFLQQAAAHGTDMRLERIVTPLALVAALALSVLIAVSTADPGRFLFTLSATVTGAAQIGLLTATGFSYRNASRSFHRAGASVSGERAAAEISRTDQVVLTDEDLFPRGSIRVGTIRTLGGFDETRALSLAAAVEEGSALGRIFSEQARQRFADELLATERIRYEGGGNSARVGGNVVLLGTRAFLKLMDIEPPAGHVPDALYLAVNGTVVAIFEVEYRISAPVHTALQRISEQAAVLLDTRDCHVSPERIMRLFALQPGTVAYPEFEQARAMRAADYTEDDTVLAVLSRDGIGPLAGCLECARSMVRLSSVATMVGIAAAVLGMLLMAYLCFVFAPLESRPIRVLLYSVLWYIPIYFIGNEAKKSE